MRNFCKLALSAAILSVSVLPAAAQNYHYNYGNSRVVNQSSVGYVQHENTYIPTGAINNTAKGVVTGGVGQKANNLLPGVAWGRTVGTSGDNFYMGGAPDKFKSAVPNYAVTPQRTITVGGAKGGQRRGGRQQQQQQQQGYFYVPGQNGSTANYSQVNTNPVNVQVNGGAASYGSGSGQKNF
ncbi:MAG: hypothetical protein SGJ27_31085 [Candidatus Melainabacteria bacterium]|nr:hypothetical protein [Candidatus Melainabacteria bacterium]